MRTVRNKQAIFNARGRENGRRGVRRARETKETERPEILCSANVGPAPFFHSGAVGLDCEGITGKPELSILGGKARHVALDLLGLHEGIIRVLGRLNQHTTQAGLIAMWPIR